MTTLSLFALVLPLPSIPPPPYLSYLFHQLINTPYINPYKYKSSPANATMSSDKQAEYEKHKKILHDAIQEKKNVDRQLTQIEEDIFAKESLYLTNTMHHSYGNIIKGFDTFVRSSLVTSHATGGLRRRTLMTDDDRIFSLSLAVYIKHLQRKNREAEDEDDEE